MKKNKPPNTPKAPALDGRAWAGVAAAYGEVFAVELFESKKHPPRYHYATHCSGDDFADESQLPVSVQDEELFWLLIKGLLRKHGLTLADISWKEAKPEDLPLSGERVKAGE